MKRFNETLNDKDKRFFLTDSCEFEDVLHSQWDENESELDDATRNRIWNGIQDKLWHARRKSVSLFYKWYSIAASVLLIFSLSGLVAIYMSEDEAKSFYVISSGNKDIENVVLPDGTIVSLGPDSRLEYPSEFISDSRDVTLKGQAFFDVVKNPQKPFRVHLDDAIQVEALGTAFEVFNYESSNVIEAVLLNGKIRVDFGHNNESQVMLPDEMLRYNKIDDSKSLSKVDADKYTSWRDGVLSFENENLSMILPRLEHWYGRKIKCYDENLLNKYRFSFKVKDESLEVILFMMRKTAPIVYEKDSDGGYILTLK